MTHPNGFNGKERIKEVLMKWIANPQSRILVRGETLQGIDSLDIRVVAKLDTRTSEIIRYVLEGVAKAINKYGEEREIPLDTKVVLKQYKSGEIKDTANRRSESGRVSLEGAVLTSLGQYTEKVPKILEHTDREIWMTDLGGGILSNRIDKIDEESTRVLEVVAQSGAAGSFQSELVETLGSNVIDIIKDLEGRGLLYRETGKLLVTTRYEDIYALNGDQKLQEKREFQTERDTLVSRAVETLLEVQMVGNNVKPQLQKSGVVQQSLQDAVESDLDYVEGTLCYGRRKLSESEDRKVKKGIISVNEDLHNLPEEIRDNFIQGDGYSENLVNRTSLKDVAILDFFHAGLGVWFSDVADLVNYTHLFSPGIMKPEDFYAQALELRIGFTPNPALFKKHQEEIVHAMTLKRALRTLGVISWILSGEGSYIQTHHHERNMLKHQRTAYALFLKERLTERKDLKGLAELID